MKRTYIQTNTIKEKYMYTNTVQWLNNKLTKISKKGCLWQGKKIEWCPTKSYGYCCDSGTVFSSEGFQVLRTLLCHTSPMCLCHGLEGDMPFKLQETWISYCCQRIQWYHLHPWRKLRRRCIQLLRSLTSYHQCSTFTGWTPSVWRTLVSILVHHFPTLTL